MPRSSKNTRRHILDSAYTLFRRKGYARANVDEIAAASGITKRSLYAHFTSKDELLAAVMDEQFRLANASFEQFKLQETVNAEVRVQNLFDEFYQWTTKPHFAGSGFTIVAIELSDLPGHPARAIARRHKAVIEAHFAKKLEAAGVKSARKRARELWLLVEGAGVLTVIHGDRSYIESAADAARELLRSSAARRSRRKLIGVKK